MLFDVKLYVQVQVQFGQIFLKIKILYIKNIIKIIEHTIKLIIKKILSFSAALLLSSSNSAISFSLFIYFEITGLIDSIL